MSNKINMKTVEGLEEGLANNANTSLSNLDVTGQAKFDAKANKDASNFTAAGKNTVVGWGMPGYFSKPRVVLQSGVWNYVDKNILVTIICIQNIQGEIYINAKASDEGAVSASSCVSPASGGKSSCQALIRKGIYYKTVFNNRAWYDELMEG